MLCLSAASSYAQLYDSVYNQYVVAYIDKSTGDFGIRDRVVNSDLLFEKGYTSHTNFKFHIGDAGRDSVVTNMSSQWGFPVGAGFITADSVTITADTATAWYWQFGYLIQERLYPVLGPSGHTGKIMIEYLTQQEDPNTSNNITGILWEADICLNSQSQCSSTGGDDPICLTSENLCATPNFASQDCWTSAQSGFQANGSSGIPDYYHAASTFPQYDCQGCAFLYARLRGPNITTPDEFYLGDWRDDGTPQGLGLKDVVWDVNGTNFSSGNVFVDAAAVYKWNITSSNSRIATLYGQDDQDGDLLICPGNLFKEVEYTPAFTRDSTNQYSPLIDSVRLYVIDIQHQLNSANNLSATIDFSGSKHLYEAGKINTLHGMYNQPFPSPNLSGGSGEYVNFYLAVDTLTFPKLGSVDIDTIKLTVHASNGVALGDSGIVCPFTIVVPGKYAPPPDTIPPAADIISSSIDSIAWSVHDSRRYDTGVDSITVVSNLNNNYLVTIAPFTRCDTADRISVTAKVIDTSKSACVQIQLTDCALNDTVISECYTPHTFIDSLPPIVTLTSSMGRFFPSLSCNDRCYTFLVADNRSTDFGLGSIHDSNAVNFNPLAINNGAAINPHDPTATCNFCIVDSMFNAQAIIVSHDFAGNETTTPVNYCSIQDSTAPVISISKGPTPKSALVVITEKHAWDRGLANIILGPGSVNVKTVPSPIPILAADSTAFVIETIDTVQSSSYSICAQDSFFTAIPANKSLYYAQDSALHETCVQGNFNGDDTLPPNIILQQTSTFSVRITVNDIHNINGKRYLLDKGLQSIEIDTDNVVVDSPAVSGSPIILYPANCDTIFTFTLKVRDTLAFCDSTAFANIVATDCALNSIQTRWVVAITPDTLPPLVTSTYLNGVVNATASDDRQYDRGLGNVGITNTVNVVPYSKNANDGRQTQTFPITILNPALPASATLTVTDRWGTYCSLTPKGNHTTVIPFQTSVMGLALGTSTIVENGTAEVSLLNKGTFANNSIDNISFQLHFDSTSLNYLSLSSVNSPLTMVTPLTTGTVQVDITKGTALTDADPLPVFPFQGLFIGSNLVIVPVKISDVVVNKGALDTSWSADKKSYLVEPSSFVTIDSGSVTIQKTCDATGGVNAFALQQNYPNPYADVTAIQYTIPGDGHVRLTVYDVFGQTVMRAVDAVQNAGSYTIPFSSAKLKDGTYFYKLDAQCTPCGHEYVDVKRMVIAR